MKYHKICLYLKLYNINIRAIEIYRIQLRVHQVQMQMPMEKKIINEYTFVCRLIVFIYQIYIFVFDRFHCLLLFYQICIYL